MSTLTPAATRAAPGLGFEASPETIQLALALYWAACANGRFLDAALAGGGGVALAASLVIGLAALNFALLGLVVPWRWMKPLLALGVVATAVAVHFMRRYAVVLDPTMLRNVLHTDWREARELVDGALLLDVAGQSALPLALLALVRPRRRPWPRGLAWRAGTVVLALGVLVGAIVVSFQPLASLLRNHKEARYLVTPANLGWALAAAGASASHAALTQRQPIGLDARPGARMAARRRPLVVVLVVGETARAANWGLAGAPRQTTPELAGLPGVISFADVTACGSNTEVSLPCMFAPVGRRDYEERTIRGQESLLHVLARAGVGVQWRDNQSGCKGVCEGVPVPATPLPALRPCPGADCLDARLLDGLSDWLARLAPGAPAPTQLVVLHMLGSHGPSYWRRVPPAFVRFRPACTDDDLRRCSRGQIANAYDNTLLYTDHLLAQLVRTLEAAGHVDTALVYLSDHGESLGENGLYLHGLPYAIAPEVQKKVPMLMWTSAGFAEAAQLDLACLRERARKPAAHDHLFHTLLSLLDVRTALHDAAWDLTAGCVAP